MGVAAIGMAVILMTDFVGNAFDLRERKRSIPTPAKPSPKPKTKTVPQRKPKPKPVEKVDPKLQKLQKSIGDRNAFDLKKP